MKVKKKRRVTKFQQVCDILKIADYKEGLLREKNVSFFFFFFSLLELCFEAGLTCLC